MSYYEKSVQWLHDNYPEIFSEMVRELSMDMDTGFFERALQALRDAFPNTPCCWETLGEEESPEKQAVESVS